MITRQGNFLHLDEAECNRIKYDEALQRIAGAVPRNTEGLDLSVSLSNQGVGVGNFLRTLAQRALLRELFVYNNAESNDVRLRMQVPDMQRTAYAQIEVGQKILSCLTDEECAVLVVPTIQDYLINGVLPRPVEGANEAA